MEILDLKFEISYSSLQQCYRHQLQEIRQQVQCSMKYV